MDARTNPYAPGAGVRPAELAGRDGEIDLFDVLRHRAVAQRPAQSIMFHGLRGVGKTVLLNELLDAARREGWIAAKVEADLGNQRTTFRRQVSSALNTSLRHAQGRGADSGRFRAALRTFKSFSLKAAPDGSLSVGVDIDPQQGRGDTGAILADLSDLAIDLGEAGRDLGVGVGLFVDEMQHLSIDELGAICQACHEATQRRVPFFVIGAGLPNLPGILATARSYAERLFHYARIDRLDLEDTRTALTRPAEDEGVAWDPEAVDVVLTASGGYPYFIQQFGQTTWNAASHSPIRRGDAVEGVRVGEELLDSGFFRARWERATRSEQDYLSAMAADETGPSATGAVAQRLGKLVTSLGPVRANLIAKGLVYSPDHGFIAFTVPGMSSFIARQVVGA